MRLGTIITGWAIALLVGVYAPIVPAQAQADPHFVERLLNQVVAPNQPDWEVLHRLVIQSFPDCKPVTLCRGNYYVWRVRSEILVFQATSPVSTDGQSFAGFYWFDLQSNPLSGTGFSTGSRMYYQSCSMDSVPGVSGYVVKTVLGGSLIKPVEEDFGLYAYKPVLLRYCRPDGALIQNPYVSPPFTCGTRVPFSNRAELLDALNGSNPLLQLEGLTWLAGAHSNLIADVVHVVHEPISESIRYWSLSNDSEVSQATSSLGASPIGWVSQAAKFYVSVNKPQPVPNTNLRSRIQSLEINDIRIGKGGDFDDKDREVKTGDRVVIEFEITLPDGTVAFTEYNTDSNPSIFQVGSNQVIEGLSKGVIGMKAGGARTILIPSSMAFGDAGADVIPPGADLTYKVRLLHIATEPPFGDAAERVLRTHEVVVGDGPAVRSGDTVNVKCKVYRLDGRELDVPEFTSIQQMVLFTGSPLKRALLGMREGGKRRLLVTFPSMFGAKTGWFHYGAQILEVKLNSIVTKP